MRGKDLNESSPALRSRFLAAHLHKDSEDRGQGPRMYADWLLEIVLSDCSFLFNPTPSSALDLPAAPPFFLSLCVEDDDPLR